MGSHTNQYYSGKQKDAQIVRIISSKAEEMVIVPNLRPHFFNAADISGAHQQDITYLVRSFSSTNRFINFDPSMQVVMRLYRVHVTEFEPSIAGNTIVERERDFEPPVDIEVTLRIGEEVAGPCCVNADQLITFLSNAIQREVYQLYEAYPYLNEHSLDPLSNSQINIHKWKLIMLRCVSFTETYGKLGCYINPHGDPSNYRQIMKVFYDNIPNQQFECVSGITFTLETVKGSHEFRVGKLFGFNQEDPEEQKYQITFDTSPQQIRDNALNAFYQVRWDNPFPVQLTYVIERRRIGNVSLTPGKFMNVLRYQRIFIRSSLMNTFWNKDGTKSDIIAVIPMEQGQDQTIKEYTFPGDSGRNWEVRETSIGAGAFSIKFTDEWDQPVEFAEDYELTIGFFFNPATNPVSQF